MKITVSHNKPKEEARRAVDRSFDDLFRVSSTMPVKVVSEHREWKEDTLIFSCSMKLGVLSTGIKGTVEVTDRDVTINADLGFLEKLLGSKGVRGSLEQNVRGLLK